MQRRADRILEELKAGKNAATLLKEYGVEWKSTGEFAVDTRSIPGLGSDDKLLEATYELSKPGEVYPQAITVGDNRMILKLKKRIDPPAKPDEVKSQALADNAVNSFGGELFRLSNKNYEEALKKLAKLKLSLSILPSSSRIKSRAANSNARVNRA